MWRFWNKSVTPIRPSQSAFEGLLWHFYTILPLKLSEKEGIFKKVFYQKVRKNVTDPKTEQKTVIRQGEALNSILRPFYDKAQGFIPAKCENPLESILGRFRGIVGAHAP